ncbi:MAG TPA: glycoside hydrolase family 97 N-terminal domain-containing protein, partial [Verrucomicrobiae bacterium]
MFLRKDVRVALRVLLFIVCVADISSAGATNSWSLASLNHHCEIVVEQNNDGSLSYDARRDGKSVISNSPMGLRCDDQDFERALVLDSAGNATIHSEVYELFSGAHTHVNHQVQQRNLLFHNTNGVLIEIDLAATDEGVAFRYRFPETNSNIRIVESELTGFTVPQNARGWLQPYHAAGPYTPAYEDFFFHVSPGDRPPDSRAKAVGWGFPALFRVPDADAWALLTESGTDESYCGCHLGPDSSGGVYRIAFPLADQATKGRRNKFGPEPRYSLPWTMPWRVIVLGKTAGDIAMSSLVTDLAPPSRLADTS